MQLDTSLENFFEKFPFNTVVQYFFERIILLKGRICCIKPLVDWLLNQHSTPDKDKGRQTYLSLTSDSQANRNHSCPVQHCFEEFIIISWA